MMLKRSSTDSRPSRRWLSAVTAGLLTALTALGLAAGCLDRPVQPQDPRTSNVFVDQIRQTAVDKIDLLFMIDNSLSMADKQTFLGEAVPILAGRLISPICVDQNGVPNGNSSSNGTCQGNGEPEFSPIKDIHIGIVTSSLGSHGGEVCTDPATGDDRGFLVGFPGVRPAANLTSWNNMGFLAWDPDTQMPRNTPPGISNPQMFIDAFTNHVLATGETGCGYEAILEAWYRFLIDPDPPNAVAKDPATSQTVVSYPAQEVLDQRAAFLRPDSLLAVIMLADENDCSIVDFGQGWIVGLQNVPGGGPNDRFRMPRSTSICETDPNNACCISCSASSVPGGCAAPSGDPSCAMNNGTYTATEDSINLRCYEQKRRFGFDLLYPVERYVQGLSQPQVFNRAGQLVQNPIFTGKDDKPARDRSLVFLAGIIGVPWQDIATMDSLNGGGLTYLTFDEMNNEGRWDMILGDAAAGTRPTDGLMFETPLDRSTMGFGPHPLTGDTIAPSTAAAGANPINGHESSIADGSDLQYACTFQLNPARDCGATGATENCDCFDEDAVYMRSLCNGTTQTHAKAYPGVRELQVLRQFGNLTGNAIVASICPKVLSPDTAPDYGYNPAVAAIIDRLKEALKGKCLPRALEVDDMGQVPCAVIEATPPGAGGCEPCTNLPGRADPSAAAIRPAVRRQLQDSGFCGGSGQPSCDSFCQCEIQQFTGNDLNRCQTALANPSDISGYCYVDPAQNMNANPEIVANCPASQRRLLRFSAGVPAPNAITFIACIGKPLTTAAVPDTMP